MAVSKMHVDAIRRWAPLFMVVVGVLLVAVLLIGTAVHGQKNWIDFGGPFRIQPSEFAKLAIIMWGANLGSQIPLTRTTKSFVDSSVARLRDSTFASCFAG